MFEQITQESLVVDELDFKDDDITQINVVILMLSEQAVSCYQRSFIQQRKFTTHLRPINGGRSYRFNFNIQ